MKDRNLSRSKNGSDIEVCRALKTESVVSNYVNIGSGPRERARADQSAQDRSRESSGKDEQRPSPAELRALRLSFFERNLKY